MNSILLVISMNEHDNCCCITVRGIYQTLNGTTGVVIVVTMWVPVWSHMGRRKIFVTFNQYTN